MDDLIIDIGQYQNDLIKRIDLFEKEMKEKINKEHEERMKRLSYEK